MQPQLGRRIRMVRKALGMSQQQLAGDDMSAAFVSMIENGRVVPSPGKLRILANRLGKPTDFFSADGEEEQETAVLLLEAAMKHQQEGDYEEAMRRFDQAFRMASKTESVDLQVHIQLAASRCLTARGQLDEALLRCENAVELCDMFREGPQRDLLVEALAALGHAQFRLEEFGPARRSYERVLRMVTGLKTHAELAFRTQCFLATCHGRLGAVETSVDLLRDVISKCDKTTFPLVWPEACLGLSAGLYQLQRYDEALLWAREAVTIYRDQKSSRLVLAEHNVAVIQGHRGSWEEAYVILRRCLEAYRMAADRNQTASILEELSKYWMQKGNLAAAEQACEEALQALEMDGSIILRGRVYWMLAWIYHERALLVRAMELLKICYEFMLKSRNRAEVTRVQEAIRVEEAGGTPVWERTARSGMSGRHTPVPKQ